MKGLIFMNKEIDLNKKHELLLNLLDEFQQYCQEHDLNCYLAGGTLLGAVRHGGFIPWDDDIDVMMPMDDYNRLVKIVESDRFREPYHISTPQNNPDHMWPFLKFIDYTTILIEPMVTSNMKKKQKGFYGVYIDIFPMYGLPNDSFERDKYQTRLCGLYKKYAKSVRVMNRRADDNTIIYGLRYLLYDILTLPNKVMGRKYYLKKISRMINSIPFMSTNYWGYTVGITSGNKDHGKTEYLKHISDIRFEDLECKILSSYDSMLSQQYGDYMELPPENKRHIHPSYVSWRE